MRIRIRGDKSDLVRVLLPLGAAGLGAQPRPSASAPQYTCWGDWQLLPLGPNGLPRWAALSCPHRPAPRWVARRCREGPRCRPRAVWAALQRPGALLLYRAGPRGR